MKRNGSGGAAGGWRAARTAGASAEALPFAGNRSTPASPRAGRTGSPVLMPPPAAGGVSACLVPARPAPEIPAADGSTRTPATNATPDAAAPSDNTRTTTLSRRRISLPTAVQIRPFAHRIVASGYGPLELRKGAFRRRAHGARACRTAQATVAH